MHRASSSSTSSSLYRNRPHPGVYIKTHKNVTFSFGGNTTTFQHGCLGDADTYLVGTVHLHYQRVCTVKNVYLHFKGKEKTCWHKAQARSKVICTGERTIVCQTNKIWEAFEETEGITTLDIPFKMHLPQGLQETIITDMGSVQYVLCATVNTKGLLGKNSHSAKVDCPLKRTLILDRTLTSPYKICGESTTGIEYTFMLPPNKYFNAGSHVSIPMILRFLRPGAGVERLEITLKTLMDFSCSQNEIKHVEQQALAVVIELQSNNSHYPLGGCTHNVNLFIPNNTHGTYQGRLINISHQLCIRFCSWGSSEDFHVEEYVSVARVIERNGETSIMQSPFLLLDASPYMTDEVSSRESTERLIVPTPGHILQDDAEYRRLVAPFDDRFNDEYRTPSQSPRSQRSLRSPPQSPFDEIFFPNEGFPSDAFTNIRTPLSPPPYRRVLTSQTSSDSMQL